MNKLSVTLLGMVFLVLFFINCGRDSGTTPGTSAVYFDWWDGTAPASYEPLVIIAAPVGEEYREADYSTVSFPQDRDEYLDEIVDCYDAGAQAVHLVPIGLEPDTSGSIFLWNWDNYKFIIDYVTENCPGMSIIADISKADGNLMDSLAADTSVSFVALIFGRYLYDGVWMGSDAPAANGAQVLYWQGNSVKILPMIVSPQQADYINRYLLPAYLQEPYHFTLTIGWENNAASTADVFFAMVNTLPDTSTLIVACTKDHPTELMGLSVAEGYHLSVGLKYAVYWPGDTYSPVTSSSFMVSKAVELAVQMNRPLAALEEAKTILDAYR